MFRLDTDRYRSQEHMPLVSQNNRSSLGNIVDSDGFDRGVRVK
jgi:hypothetical protein